MERRTRSKAASTSGVAVEKQVLKVTRRQPSSASNSTRNRHRNNLSLQTKGINNEEQEQFQIMSQYSQLNETRDNNRIVYFILPTGTSQETCSQNLASAYMLSEEHDIVCQWMSEEQCLTHEPVHGNVFVLDPFEGPAFEYLLQSRRQFKNLVIGPQFLRSIIQDTSSPSVVYRTEPSFSLAMNNVLITFTGVSDAKRKELTKKVEQMCGYVSSHLSVGVTHVVANKLISDKVFIAYDNGIPVMTTDWIDAVWQSSQSSLAHGTAPQFVDYACKMLHNLNICVSQLSASMKSAVKSVIEDNGGKYSADLQKQSTDILILPEPIGNKYLHASQWRLPCVTADWIEACKAANHIVRFKQFAVSDKIKTSTPNSSMVNPPSESGFHVDDSLCSRIDHPLSHVNQSVETTMAPPLLEAIALDTEKILTKAANDGLYLDGCQIYVCGSKSNNKVRKLLNASGALRTDRINENVTHVIVADGKVSDTELVEIRKLDTVPHIVTVEWLIESAKQGSPVCEDDYRFEIPCKSEECNVVEPSTSRNAFTRKHSKDKKGSIETLRAQITPESERGRLNGKKVPTRIVSEYVFNQRKSKDNSVEEHALPEANFHDGSERSPIDQNDEELNDFLNNVSLDQHASRTSRKDSKAKTPDNIETAASLINTDSPVNNRKSVLRTEATNGSFSSEIRPGSPIPMENGNDNSLEKYKTESFFEFCKTYKTPEGESMDKSSILEGYEGLSRSATREIKHLLKRGSPFKINNIPLKKRTSTPVEVMMARGYEELIQRLEDKKRAKAAAIEKDPSDNDELSNKYLESDSRPSSKRNSSNTSEERIKLQECRKRLKLDTTSDSDMSDPELEIVKDTSKSSSSVNPATTSCTHGTSTSFNVTTEAETEPKIKINEVPPIPVSNATKTSSIEALKNLLGNNDNRMIHEESRIGRPLYSSTPAATRVNRVPMHHDPTTDALRDDEIDAPHVVWEMAPPPTAPNIITNAQSDDSRTSMSRSSSSSLSEKEESGSSSSAISSSKGKPKTRVNREVANSAKRNEKSNRVPLAIPTTPGFMISGQTEETKELLTEIIQALGGVVLSDKPFHEDAFGIVASTLARSEKVLCSIASGKPLIKNMYFQKCQAAGRFVPLTEDVVWREGDARQNNQTEKDLARSAFAWMSRRLKNKLDTPFRDVKFYISEDSPNKIAAFTRLIENGGGKVVQIPDEANIILCDAKKNIQRENKSIPIHPLSYLNKAITNA